MLFRSGIGSGQGPACSPAAAGEAPPTGEPSEFLLVKECAAQARVSPRTIYELVRHGHVEAIRLGRDIRIYARSWHAYLHALPLDLHPSPELDGDGQRTALQRCAPLRQAPDPDQYAPHTRERRRSCSALPDERDSHNLGPNPR